MGRYLGFRMLAFLRTLAVSLPLAVGMLWVSGPLFAENIVARLGQKNVTITGIRIAGTSVCDAKALIAQKLDLPMEKFDIMSGYQTLPEANTLKDAGLRSGSTIGIKPVKNSTQC